VLFSGFGGSQPASAYCGTDDFDYLERQRQFDEQLQQDKLCRWQYPYMPGSHSQL
jgi:hypothetical protein